MKKGGKVIFFKKLKNKLKYGLWDENPPWILYDPETPKIFDTNCRKTGDRAWDLYLTGKNPPSKIYKKFLYLKETKQEFKKFSFFDNYNSLRAWLTIKEKE